MKTTKILPGSSNRWWMTRGVHHTPSFRVQTAHRKMLVDMGVSNNRGYPQIINSNRVFPDKPSILRYPYFLETPICIQLLGFLVRKPHPIRLKTRYGFFRWRSSRLLDGWIVPPKFQNPKRLQNENLWKKCHQQNVDAPFLTKKNMSTCLEMFNQSTECFMEFFCFASRSYFEVQGEGLLVPQGCLEAQRSICSSKLGVGFGVSKHGGFLKWWYPTTMGFPSKNDHFGVWNGGFPTI